jgi:hypothetical protein
MRFTEAMAHLAVALRDPLAEHTELLRAMREGSEGLEATERKLSRMAAADGYPFDWGGTFKDLFRGKPGPGGGFDVSPTVLAFYLIGYLLDCPRREVAAKALDMVFASVRGDAVCKKTGERYFGAAFVALLSNRALFERVDDIGVCGDLGMARPVFVDFTTTGFYPSAHDTAKPGTYSVKHLWPAIIAPLFDLIQAKSVDRTPARKRRLLTA